MFSDRTTARIVGVLFIVASGAAIAGGSLLLPLGEAEYLIGGAGRTGQIVSGALLELLLVISVVAIAALMYPVLKRWNEGLALGYLGVRTLEGVLPLAAAMSGLLIPSLGSDHDGVATEVHVVVGESLLAMRSWTYLVGSLVMLGVAAIILNSLLYRSRLVPVWLSAWGLLGGGLILMRGLIELYGVDLSGLVQGIFAAPIGIQEMVFAGWLLVRGFDSTGPSRSPSRAEAETADLVGARGRGGRVGGEID